MTIHTQDDLLMTLALCQKALPECAAQLETLQQIVRLMPMPILIVAERTTCWYCGQPALIERDGLHYCDQHYKTLLSAQQELRRLS
jgi:hypothetical protein